MPKNEPNAKDVSDKPVFSEEFKSFIVELRAKCEQDESDTSLWKDKMVVASNQRLGVKKWTDYPYPNAPDIPLPETDKLIKKSVAPLVLSTWSPKKMVTVRVKDGVEETPELKEKAMKTELVMNSWLRSEEMDWYRKLTLAADNSKHYGHCLFRIYEEFKKTIRHEEIYIEDFAEEDIELLRQLSTEEKKAFAAERFKLDPETDSEIITDIIKQFNSGEKVIEFDVEEISSMPNIEIPVPTKLVAPAHTTDINKSVRLRHEVFMTRQELEEQMNSEVFLDHDLDSIDLSGLAKADTEDIVEGQKDRNEGVESTLQKDLFRVHIINAWYRENKTDPLQRWVFVFLADATSPEESLLYSKPFGFDWNGWDYEKHDNEIKDARYYSSRGIPEQIRAIQEIMERSINNMLIRDEYNNTPMWEVSTASEIMDGHINFGPGSKIPVSQIGTEIKKLNENISVDVSSERIMQLMKATAEEYMSSTDQLFRNATNSGGGKTKGEITMGIQQASGPISMDVINWNNSISRVYKKLFEVLRDRVGESLVINGVVITKDDFNFPADVRSNGNLEVSDQQLATNKAQARLSNLASLQQFGIVNQEDLYNGAKDWLEKDGVKNPDQFVTDPKIAMKEEIGQLTQQLQQLQQALQQGSEQIQKDQKTIGRNKQKIDKDISNAEGQLQGIEENKQEASQGV